MRSYRRTLRILLFTVFASLLTWAGYHSNLVFADQRSGAVQQVPGNPYRHDFEIWVRLAQQGDAEAQFIAGLFHGGGEGIPVDYAKAYFWYQKAANQGHVDAQFNLAHLYLSGNGVPRDASKAIEWWQKAAEKGHVRAQYNLGYSYYLGIGVEKDDQQALRWIRSAAENKNERAMAMLKKIESQRVPLVAMAGDHHEKTRSQRNQLEIPASTGQVIGKPAVSNKEAISRLTYEGTTSANALNSRSGRSNKISDSVSGGKNMAISKDSSTSTRVGIDRRDADVWLFKQPADSYTLQLVSGHDVAGIAAFLRGREISGEAKILQTKIEGKQWWYILYGNYRTREAAKNAIKAMKLKPESVWIRRVGDVQKKRCRNLASVNSPLAQDFCVAQVDIKRSTHR